MSAFSSAGTADVAAPLVAGFDLSSLPSASFLSQLAASGGQTARHDMVTSVSGWLNYMYNQLHDYLCYTELRPPV